MLRRTVVLALALLLSTDLVAARRRPVTAVKTPLAATADAAIRPLLEAGVPGASVAVLHRGELIYANGFGQTSRSLGSPTVTASTVFQIGSVSKQFAAAAVMRLVEEGKVALDDRVTTVVPELNDRGKAITLRHLLTHTSGLPEYTSQLTDAFDELTRAEFFALVNSGALLFDPGTRFRYNNSGYYLLALIVERLAARPYDQFIVLELTSRAGLSSSGRCGGFAAPAAPGGSAYVDGVWYDTPPIHMSNAFGAGDLCATAVDLVRWSRALASGAIVSPASYLAMTTPLRLANGIEVPYGFGLTTHLKLGRNAASHNGFILGFQAQLAYYAADDLAVAVLINSGPSPGGIDIVAIEETIAAAALATAQN